MNLLYAQDILLEGKITDSFSVSIEGVNLLAIPKNSKEKINFSISDKNGRYQILLKKNSYYYLELSYMGLNKLFDTIVALEDQTRNFKMIKSQESLDEILINASIPVIVKKDTIIYSTGYFKTGEERKLKEVLSKLPGVEVNRDGTVTVNGKKVNKLMVDGKAFFTGDTKLAIENIPAEAVDEVEVLDNYSEIPFLKGLEDSEKMVMNIKLAEGKKKFSFGEIVAGSGLKERYLFHPTLFYYSPKTSINFIGDFNNYGKKSFSMRDYLNFEGGNLPLMNSFQSSIYNDEFSQFLSNEDFKYSRNEFGAINIVQKINNVMDINAYTIASKNVTEMREENYSNYVNSESILDERRETQSKNQIFFSLTKLRFRYIPDANEDLTYDAHIKSSNGNIDFLINTNNTGTSNFINTIERPKSLKFSQNLSYSNKFSYNHTSTINFNHQYSTNFNANDWFFNRALFSSIIPFIEQDREFQLVQNTSSKLNRINMILKHYWVINNTNHLYPSFGIDYSTQKYTTRDFQLLNDERENSFAEEGFNNSLDFQLLDYIAGFQYKVKIGNLILKPGVFYHFYQWNIGQLMNKAPDKRKDVVLPEFDGEYQIGSSEKLKLKYNLNSRFSNASNYANRLKLTDFNRLFQGNANLENELYHSTSLSYFNFNLFNGIYINANLRYVKREQSVRQTTIIEGIDQIVTAIYTELPEEDYGLSASFSKKMKKYKVTFQANGLFTNYQRRINDKIVSYNNKNYGINLKAETSFKRLPNIELGIQNRLNEFQSNNFSNTFILINPYINFKYDFLKAFIFKADYAYNFFENQNREDSNRFEMGNASLYYNKVNSPWGFEMEVNNFFNEELKQSNSINQFIVSERRTFIQPRTILLKLSYKL